MLFFINISFKSNILGLFALEFVYVSGLVFPGSYSVHHISIGIGGNFERQLCEWVPIFRAQSHIIHVQFW